MPRGIASSNQLSIMNKVLAAYCETYRVGNEEDREDAAALILQLFDRGLRDEEALLAALVQHRDRHRSSVTPPVSAMADRCLAVLSSRAI